MKFLCLLSHVQASRETISRLASYASRSQRESTSQLQALREKLETERSRALHMENKLKTFQVRIHINVHTKTNSRPDSLPPSRGCKIYQMMLHDNCDVTEISVDRYEAQAVNLSWHVRMCHDE